MLIFDGSIIDRVMGTKPFDSEPVKVLLIKLINTPKKQK